MSHIQLCEVSYRYNDRFVLKGVSAAFHRNRVTAILGRSGSGKSTMLQLIMGLISPYSGEVLVDGAPRNYPPSLEQRYNFGYVIQGNGLFPHLTVGENISLPGRMTNVQPRACQIRTRFLMEFARLRDNSYNKFPYQLTIAEQARVLLCRAYFTDPPVLLMDEPFGALAAPDRRELQVELQLMQQKFPRTVLLVTHDRADAERIADDILVLDHGQVQQHGRRQKVFLRPANLNVKHVLEAAF